MAAAQYIASARQGLTAFYGVLNESISARSSLERTIAPTQKRLEVLTAEYDRLHRYSTDIHQRYKSLQDQHNRLKADHAQVREAQAELQTTKAELQKELDELRVLRESAEVQLQRTQNELTALSDWRTQEARAYNKTIETLRETVQEKNNKLAATEEDLERELKHALKLIQDNEAAEAKASQLKDTVAAYELRIRELEEQNSTLRSENESAMKKIQHFRDSLEDGDARNDTLRLQSEIESLRKSLSAAEEARKKSEAGETRFRDENASLTQKLGSVKEVLAMRFPEINSDSDLENLASVIDKNGEKRGKKRRRCGK